MAFKMKGNPMKRNFGIGASPTKPSSYKGVVSNYHSSKDPRKGFSPFFAN